MVIHQTNALRSVLIFVILVLLGQVAWQARRIEALKSELGFTQRHLEERAGDLAAERLNGRREDIVRAAQWLHEFYGSADGLRRPEGLWLSQQKQPDFEALRAWVFDVYLNARVHGASDADARQAVVDAIKGTDEWRQAHARQ
jgi:transcriptional regulator with XRE-family HTH domain